MRTKGRSDRILSICVLMLVLAGILMVFSSSFYYALQRFGNQYYFFQKALLWAGVGTAAMLTMSLVPYRALARYAGLFLVIDLVLLILVFTPLGMELNGARRWIDAGPITIMPGEVAKFAVVLFMAAQLSKEKSSLRSVKDLLPYLAVLVIIFALIIKQPNLSTAVTVFAVGFLLLYVAGLPMFYVFGLGGLGIAAGVVLIKTEAYRMKRFLTFMDPFKDTSDTGWQVVQSLFALGSGGFWGRGLGESIQNKLYIPEPQNDFIFATIGEEFGFIGTTLVLLLFAALIWRGVKIAMNAKDRFGFFLATGITATVALQTLINIAVATSSMPATGVPLPFISFGGNNLALLMAQMGILLNISRTSLNGDKT